MKNKAKGILSYFYVTMKQIILEIPESKYEFFEELMDQLGFVKSKSKGKNADWVYTSIARGLKEVKLIRSGKLPKKSIQKLLREI